MANILKRIKDSIFNVYERKELEEWNYPPDINRPIYGVYHVMLDEGWEKLVRRQITNLKVSGLLEASSRLYISCISAKTEDVNKLLEIIDSDKVEIISNLTDPKVYEYPALKYIKELADKEDCLFYYFHTKGISYQSLATDNKRFLSFKAKINAWREMMEYFIFSQWKVAVNILNAGFDSYGCYRWPPKHYTMFSGSFWWANASLIRRLPAFNEETIAKNRFYSEIWLFERKQKQFSAFDSIADLYFVRIPRSIYTGENRKWKDEIYFSFVYNVRKIEKHIFKYNYKKRCQKEFQRLKIDLSK